MNYEKKSLLQENFESYSVGYDLINAPDWSYYETGSTVGTGIIQTGKSLELKKVSGFLNFWSYMYESAAASSWSNYEIELDIVDAGSGGLIGFVGGYMWLRIYLQGGGSPGWYSRIEDGSPTAPAAANYNPSNTYKISDATPPTKVKIVVSDLGYSVYYNDQITPAHDNITPDQTTGGIGFSCRDSTGFRIDNLHVYELVEVDDIDNETYFKKNKLHVSTDIKFQLNNGTTLNDEQNITKYAVDINKLTEKLSKSSTVSGGVILPSLSLKLDNSRGVWNKQGAKFKNGFINNSLVKITTSYLDSDLNTITPSFVYKGIMKYSSSSWDREKFLFNTTLSPSTGLLSSEKIEAGILSNNTFAYIIYKILNRAPFNRYMTISQSNINLGWDVSSTDDVSDMVNSKVKDVLDKIMLLTGSVYYVDYDQNFIVEPIEESTPTALMTIRGQDILNIKSEEYYWDGQYTAVKWDDGENTIKRVEMNYTNRSLYQYDYVELVLKDKYITDDAKRSTILNSLLNLYQFLKRMVKLTIKWTPSITVNKYVALDVPNESIKNSDQFIWNDSKWNDGKFWNASQPGTTFSSGDLWRVLEVSRDTTGEKMDVVLLQHRSDDEK